MKKLFVILFILISSLAYAQSTTVTATVVDGGGQVWANGIYQIDLINFQGGQPKWTGGPLTIHYGIQPLSIGGFFTITIPDNNYITPRGTMWRFTICPNATSSCGIVDTAINGPAVDISSIVTPKLPVPIVYPSTTLPKAYGDTEVKVSGYKPNSQATLYYDVSANCIKYFDGLVWLCTGTGGGGGVFPKTITKIASQWLDSYDAVTGLFTQSQPTWSDIAGIPPLVGGTGTVNFLPIWLDASDIGNSIIEQQTDTLVFHGIGPFSVNSPYGALPPLSAATTATQAVDPDGTLEVSVNGGAYVPYTTGPGVSISNHCTAFGGVDGKTLVDAGGPCGTGSGNFSATGTLNKLVKFTGANSGGDSQVTDDGTHAATSPNGLGLSASGGLIWDVPNNTITGTSLSKMACNDGTGKAIICPSSGASTNHPFGVAIAGVGTSPGIVGSTSICLIGFCNVIFDNAATANHYAVSSPTIDGDLTDVGAVAPTTGQPFYSIVVGNGGAGTAATIRDLTGDTLNASSGGVTSVSGTSPIASTGGTTPTISINDTAVTPGSYTYANFTVDQKGRLTAAGSGTAPVTSVGATSPVTSSGGTTPTIACPTCTVGGVTNVTGTSPIASSGGTTPAISLNDTAVTPGSYTLTSLTVDQKGRITSASNGTAYTLPTQYTKLRCSTGLGDGLNAMTAGTYVMLSCVNDSGVTWTVTAIHCYTDNAGSSTLDVKNNAGTSFLTGAVTCNATKTSGGAAGTASGTTTLANTDAFNFTFVADGTSKTTTWTVSLTQ